MKKSLFLLLFVPSIVFAQKNSLDIFYEGILSGVFSVSPTQTVSFSKGNLQFNSSLRQWKFAEHQYDYIGEDPDYIGGRPLEDMDGWIDSMWWGQNGYYGVYPGDTRVPTYDVNGAFLVDWGYEPVINGGWFNNMWRTLSIDEWQYILKDRKNAKEKFSTATVCGVKGLIILPDNWVLPSGCSFNKENAHYEGNKGTLQKWNVEPSDYSNNVYYQSQWAKMEKNGALFLPAGSIGDLGFYWTSSASEELADVLTFGAESIYTSYEPKYKYNGMSVRLVKNNVNVLYKSPSSFETKLYSVVEKANVIKATFDYFVESEWITIDPNAYIVTNTGDKAKLISTEGIEISPQKTIFNDESIQLRNYRFSLIFESLPKPLNTYKSFSIIESADSDWKWADIHVNW